MKVLLIHNKDITMEYLEDILESKCIWAEVIVALPDKFTLEVMRTIRFDMVIGSVHQSSIGVIGDFLEEVRRLDAGEEVYTYMAIEKETLGLLHQDFLHTVDDFISLPLDREEFGYRLAKAAKRMMKAKASEPSRKEENAPERASERTFPQVAESTEAFPQLVESKEAFPQVVESKEAFPQVVEAEEAVHQVVEAEEAVHEVQETKAAHCPEVVLTASSEEEETAISFVEEGRGEDVEMMAEPSYDELLRARELRREKEKAERERQERLKWERIEEAERNAARVLEKEQVVASAFREQAVGDHVERVGISFHSYERVTDDYTYPGEMAEVTREGAFEPAVGAGPEGAGEGSGEEISLEDIPCEPSYEDLLRERELRLQRERQEAVRQSMAKKFSAFHMGQDEGAAGTAQGQAAVLLEEPRTVSKAETIQEEIDLLKHLRKDYHARTSKVNTSKFRKEKRLNSEKRQKKETRPAGVLAKVSRLFLLMLLVVLTTVAVFYFTGRFEGGVPVVLNLDSISHLWGMLR